MNPRRWIPVGAVLAATLMLAACTGTPPRSSDSSGRSDTTSAGHTAPGPSAGTGTGTARSSAAGTAAPYPTSPPVPSPQSDQAAVLDALPGSAAATCATVGTQAQVRAGSVAVGDFRAARAVVQHRSSTSRSTPVSLFVIPERTAGVTQAVVTVTALHGQAPSASAVGRTLSQADAWTYLPVTVAISAEGPYRLSVVAGGNRGCFDVTF